MKNLPTVFVTDDRRVETVGQGLAALRASGRAAADDGLVEGVAVKDGPVTLPSGKKLVGRDAMIFKINNPDEVQASTEDTSEGPVLVGANYKKLVGRDAMIARMNAPGSVRPAPAAPLPGGRAGMIARINSGK
jgi:hypothetical protein